MASYNKVLMMGNLTRDPQLKFMPSQTAVVDFGIACNRKYKLQSGEQKEEVTFVDCSAFGRTAEVINEHFKKGKPIFIEGRLKYEQWEDKNGGGKRSRLLIHVDNFQFIGGNDAAGQDGGSAKRHGVAADLKKKAHDNPPADPFKDEQQPQLEDSEIPF